MIEGADWKTANLSLSDKTRESVHRWKEKTKFLPDFLSDSTREMLKAMDAEADEIIKEGKIEDGVFYFDKLDSKEKEECLKKLKELM